jgi:hypothetical protein
VSECLPHALITRAGEGVGEGRVEEGGGVRGCEVSMLVCPSVHSPRASYEGTDACLLQLDE